MLGEGQTPLVKSRAIGPALGLPNLYFKLENLNPTGSYKDRFAAVYAGELVSNGQRLCLATSSGNTGAALSAYCAAAGISCLLMVVDGAPRPKITQMQLYGATVYEVARFGKDPLVTSAVFDGLETFAASRGIPLPVSAYRYCPTAMQGVQTIAYEILDELPGGVDHLFVPAGGGGLALATARGVLTYGKQEPAVHCVQPAGNDTIASALRNKQTQATAVAASTTAISGLQVPSVIDGDETIRACRRLGGNGYVVQDEVVLHYQRELARKEGIFCEPAGAVALAGLADALQREEVNRSETAVCLVTGSGFKDMGSISESFSLPPVTRLTGVDTMQQLLTIL